MTDNPKMPCSDVSELCPLLERGAREFLRRCELKGLKVKITQTYRSAVYQNSLYRQGRTTAGNIVTNLDGYKSTSPHQFRIAFDICQNIKGKEYSDTSFFKKCGAVWKEMGGVWGGDWTSFVDMPHFEYTANKGYNPFRSGFKFAMTDRMPWELTAKPSPVIPPKKEDNTEMVDTTKVLYNNQEITVERILKDNTNYIKLRDLEKFGMKIYYDEVKKMPIIIGGIK